MKITTKKLLVSAALIGGAIGGAAAASYALTKNFIKVALNREEPKLYKVAKERISGMDSAVNDILKEAEEEGKRLENSGLEVVEITAHDGAKLIGHWYYKKENKRTIIAMHGWRSSWARDFCMASKFWYENGCNVLYAEQRAQNNSGGEYMGFGMIERFDCLDWINWANEKLNFSLPIYLNGLSMGAATVLMTAGFDLPENVKGITADCAFTSAKAIWRHVVKNNMNISYNIFAPSVDELCKKTINMKSDEYTTLKALETNKVPIFFVHGTDDSFVPVEMTYENYKACKAPKRLLIVPGAEHGMSYAVDKERYEKMAKQFWADFDNAEREK